MVTLFIIILITACLGLGFIVLIQNPKGGGLNANVGGLSNNFMGVKQTTDVLEKATWVFAGVIAILAICSSLFLTNSGSILNGINTKAGGAPPAQQQQQQQQPKQQQQQQAPAAGATSAPAPKTGGN
jgi:preprotein translocase subunit SecG